jgi:hypothetical protein
MKVGTERGLGAATTVVCRVLRARVWIRSVAFIGLRCIESTYSMEGSMMIQVIVHFDIVSFIFFL